MKKGILRQQPATEQHPGLKAAKLTRLGNQEGLGICHNWKVPTIGENEDGADAEGTISDGKESDDGSENGGDD